MDEFEVERLIGVALEVGLRSAEDIAVFVRDWLGFADFEPGYGLTDSLRDYVLAVAGSVATVH